MLTTLLLGHVVVCSPGNSKKCRPSEVASGNVRDPEACRSDVIKKGKHLLVITTDYDS